MGINAVNSNNYNYYTRGVNNNFTLANSYANTPVFRGNNKTVVEDSFNNTQSKPAKDGKDDGSIGFWGALKNIVKGVGNFFKGMICDENGKFSFTRTLTTLAVGAAIGAACVFLPTIAIAGTAFSTLGLISAGFGAIAAYHVGSSAIDVMNAKTDAEAEQAWQGMGSALTEGGLAYLGYRASGGIFAKDVVPTTSVGPTPKTTPKTEPVVETEPIVTTPKAEPVIEPEPIVITPKTEPVVEEPVVTTPKIEPIVEESVVPKPEPVVEKPINQVVELNEYEQLLWKVGDKAVETQYYKDYMPENIIDAFGDYIEMYGENSSLRKGLKPGELTLDMDKGFELAPAIEEDAVVYRGLEQLGLKGSQKFLDSFKEGAIVEDKGFMSTSISLKHVKNTQFIDRAINYEGIVMRIHLPKGTKGVKLDYEEFLLPRNSKIKINSIQEVNGVKVADCEYIYQKQNLFLVSMSGIA